MPIQELQRKWFVLQENSQTSSPIFSGPFFDEPAAIAAAQAAALKSPGIAYSVARVTTAYQTNDPVAVQLKFAAQAGAQP